MRTNDETRPFTIVFFTDGQPTIGETNSEKILTNVGKKNTANTRIFTFGVGDDVNATMLDALAEKSRAISTYVRETEDIEAKVTGLYAKISNPGAVQPEADRQRRRQAQRGLSAATARPVPRHPARGPGPLQRQGRQDDRDADRHGRQAKRRNSPTK